MTTTTEMKTTALASWFGANRIRAENVGKLLKGCDWVGVPFCGGCSELPYIECRAGVANDKHRHLINLARVVKDPAMNEDLGKRLDATLFHPDELAKAQARCRQREEESEESGLFNGQKPPFVPASLSWAYDYFISVWMARGANAGTDSEFRGSLPTRYNTNGGGSNTRFRSARDSLAAWMEVCRPWEFECLDAFEFIGKIKEFNSKGEKIEGLGIYADAPWPDAGDGYRHKFTEAMQRKLSKVLAAYQHTRIVIRYGDHPLIRELYPETHWTWHMQDSRDQNNSAVREVLIVNRGAAE